MSRSRKRQSRSTLSFFILLGLILTITLAGSSANVFAQDDADAPAEEPVEEVSVVEEEPPAEEPEEPVEETTVVEEEPPAEEPTEAVAEPIEEDPVTEVPQEEPVVEETPAPEVTDEPTVVEPEPEVTDEVLEVEPETTQEATEATPEPETTEEEVIEEPTENPVVDAFNEDFEEFDSSAWLLAGWEVAAESDTNAYLIATASNATATILNLDWADFDLSADFRVDENSTASVSFRVGDENYRVLVGNNGSTRFYRNDEVLQSSIAADSDADESQWFTLDINAVAGTINVSINGEIQYSHVDAQPLTNGSIIFSTGASNEGSVALDNIAMSEVDEAIVVEVTDEPVVEVTEEPVVEETVVEAPEEVVEFSADLILSADFESDAEGWASTGSANIVAAGEENQALLMAAESTFDPAEALELADIKIDAQVNILAATEVDSLNLTFVSSDAGNYDLSLNTTGASLSRTDADGTIVVATSETTYEAATWNSISVVAQAGNIEIAINDVVELSYTDDAALNAGSFAFAANANVMLDNIAVYGFTPVEVEVVEESPTLTEEGRAKLPNLLAGMLTSTLEGNDEQALAWANKYGVPLDEANRIQVQVFAGDEIAVEDISTLVETVGGEVTDVRDEYVEAFLPISSLLPLANSAGVDGIRPPALATSTSTLAVEEPGGTTNVTEAFDVLGIEDWHEVTEATIGGSGTRIAVIDTGFGSSRSTTGDFECLRTTAIQQPHAADNDTSNSHGLSVIQIICDIAPESDVDMYVATTPTKLADVVTVAASTADIILIALDLGADTSPGDGTGDPSLGVSDPYDAIQTARQNGVVVIASAGNNNGRYITFNDNRTGGGGAASSTTVELDVTDGDQIRVSWNNWGNTTNIDYTITFNGGNVPTNTASASTTVTTIDCAAGIICTRNLVITRSAGNNVDGIVQVQVIPKFVTGDLVNGGDAGQDLDVTVNGITGDGSEVTDAGNLARPADSPYVIAVGGVCASYENNFPILANSSIGPIFGAGGVAPTISPDVNAATAYESYTRDLVKPDLVGPSHVTTGLNTGTSTADCDGTTAGSELAGGFGGTSAAAAHIAGMTALLMDDNLITSVNNTFPDFDAGSVGAADSLQDYLQTRVVEMPYGAAADGFDMTYGAGMTVLGSPYYNQSHVGTLGAQPGNDEFTNDFRNGLDNIPACDAANVTYVGIGNVDDAVNGNATTPYVQPAYALRVAADTGTTNDNCVVVLPGEYVSPLLINGLGADLVLSSFNDATFLDKEASIFWTGMPYFSTANDGDPDNDLLYLLSSSVYVDNGSSNNVAINGFNFIPRNIRNTDIVPPPQAITVYQTTGTTIRNNTFGEVTIDDRVYDGWQYSSFDPTIINILNGSHNTVVDSNIFDSNTLNLGGVSAIKTSYSGTNGANSVKIIGNRFIDNTAVVADRFGAWNSIVFSNESAIDYVGNVFSGNTTHVVIEARTATSSSSLTTTVVSNMFFNNTANAQGVGVGTIPAPGPLINFYWVPTSYVVNNTFVDNNVGGSGGDSEFGALIGRGNANRTDGVSNTNGSLNDSRWEIHNNLFFDNVAPEGVVDNIDDNVAVVACRDLGNNIDEGATFNWYYDVNGTFDAQEGGTCDQAIRNDGNSITNQDPEDVNGFNQFIGSLDTIDLDPDTDWQYYALRQTVGDDLNTVPVEPNEFSIGIDAADDTPGVDLTTFPYDEDVFGRNRTIQVPDWEQGVIAPDTNTFNTDIGAFEFSPLKLLANPLVVGPFAEDTNVPFVIDVESNVEGGFGEITYQVQQIPNNFAINCGIDYTTENGGVFFDSGIANYCSPLHFYTDSAGGPSLVQFTYTVVDEALSQQTGTVQFDITPVNDSALTTDITHNAAGDIKSPLRIQLRPFVRFDNYSLNHVVGNEADFPFQYSNINHTNLNGDIVIQNAGAIEGPGGGSACGDLEDYEICVTFNEKGEAEITYDVTSLGGAGGTINNTINIRAVSQIPTAGLYDDTSFVFEYSDSATFGTTNPSIGGWDPIFSEDNINNTLHITDQQNDKAQFRFIGTGFVLYLQGQGSDEWEFRINNIAPEGAWTLLPGTENVYQMMFDVNNDNVDDATCTTSADVDGLKILTRLRTPYVVSCNGLDEALGIYSVEMTNLGLRSKFAIDAVAIVKDDVNVGGIVTDYGPFPPGTHDAEEAAFRALFNIGAEWVEVSDRSGDLAMQSICGDLACADIAFQIKDATGFAIETSLFDKGASYEICVSEEGNVNTVCQDYNNGLDETSRVTEGAFRPFYGLNPSTVYDVTIRNFGGTFEDRTLGTLNKLDNGGYMIIDSIVVFPDTLVTDGTLPFGPTDTDTFNFFVLANGTEEGWVTNTRARNANNGTVSQLDRGVIAAGPFASFGIPTTANTIYWQHNTTSITRETEYALICVNRAVTAATNIHGNCIEVNLQVVPGDRNERTSYFNIAANGTRTAGTRDIQLVDGVIIIEESLFTTAWGDTDRDGDVDGSDVSITEHIVEIFSLTNESITIDQVTILNSNAGLVGGFYEEYATHFDYFDFDGANYTEITQLGTYDRRTLFFNENNLGDADEDNDEFAFGFAGGRNAPRGTSGSGAILTNGEGNAIRFEITGTGFAPSMIADRTSGRVNICWRSGSGHTVDDVLTGGTCEVFDNNSARPEYGAYRPILGLASNTYTVVIQMLENNYVDGVTRTPLAMWFDGVEVYDEDWTTLNQLTTGMRYEGNFNDRVGENNFIYTRDGWEYEVDRRPTHSNDDFDNISRVVGAGVLFRANGGNTVVVYRDTNRGYSDLRICHAEESSTSARTCYTMSQELSSRGYQRPIVIQLPNMNPHIISISTLGSGIFNFDAVEVVDSSAPLTAGTYDDTYPSINYTGQDDALTTNYVTNGDMEFADDIGTANDSWTAIGAPTITSGRGFINRASRAVEGANGTGIQSEPFSLQTGVTYTVIARVYIEPDTADVKMALVNDGTNAEIQSSIATNTISRAWQTVRFEYTPGTQDVRLEFTANGGAGDFSVDDVQVVAGSIWYEDDWRTAYGGFFSQSQSHGSALTFDFTGTGFEIGTPTGRDGGEFEVCYGEEADYNNTEQCFIYQGEDTRGSYTVSRTVTGLDQNTYTVNVRDVEDGITVTRRGSTTTARTNRNAIGKLAIDYVRIYDSNALISVPAGNYNEDLQDNSGNQYLQLLPSDIWGSVSGTSARNYSEQSYFSILERGRASRNYAGPAATLQVELPSGINDATVILYSDGSRSNTANLLVCVEAFDGRMVWDGTVYTVEDRNTPGNASDNCTIVNPQTSSRLIINSVMLPALARNGEVGATTRTVTYQAVTPGAFSVDGYQVLYSTAMSPGFYEEFIGTAVLQETGTWETEANRLYSGGEARVTEDAAATMTFQIEDSTGFSIVTQGVALQSGDTGPYNIEIDIDGITVDYLNQIVDLSTLNTRGQATISFAGLKQDDYTVTITNVSSPKVIIDAVDVYGDLQPLGSLYDDSSIDTNGNLFLDYGPDNNAWESLVDSRRNADFIDYSYHETDQQGASVAFAVGDIDGFIVHYDVDTRGSTDVQICWTRTDTGARDCSQTLDTTTGTGFASFPVPAIGGTSHHISLINGSSTFTLDAIQLLEGGAMSEGIYQQDYIGLGTAGIQYDFGGGYSDNPANFADKLFSSRSASDGTSIQLANGEKMEFQMVGTGFSIVLADERDASRDFTICISNNGGNSGDCDTAVTDNEIPATLPTTGSGSLRTITFTGLHANAAGDETTRFVSIENTSGSNEVLLHIDRVEVLGARDRATFGLADGEQAEDESPKTRFFPFGSLAPVEYRSGGPSGTQHIGDMIGSTIYFEFEGSPQPGFEYVREVSTRSYGDVEVCYGIIGTDTLASVLGTAQCSTVSNNTATVFQRSASILPTPATACSTGCWVTIMNRDGEDMPFDFARIFDGSDPMLAGYYEENFPSLSYFDETGATIADPIADDTFDFNEERNVSGGFVAATDNINAGIQFRFTGTGFIPHFTLDPYADAVELCVLPDNGGAVVNPADVYNDGNATCVEYDNDTSRATYIAARPVLGLPLGTYAATIRMLDDNGLPTVHNDRFLPLTMQFDAIEIISDTWMDVDNYNNTDGFLNILTTGQRYETDYDDRMSDNNFIYYGSEGSRTNRNGWSYVTETRVLRSNGDYDTVSEYGASLLFRTNGANAMTLYRDVSSRSGSLLVCVTTLDGTTGNSWSNNLGNGDRSCTVVENSVRGSYYQQPATVVFSDADLTEFVVSITTLDGSIFGLDAIELFDVTAPLTAGQYEATNPKVFYDAAYTNHITNGDMELDANWVAMTIPPSTNEQSTTGFDRNRTSRYVVANNNGGIENDTTFTLTNGVRYTIIGRVYINSTSSDVTMRLSDGTTLGEATATSTQIRKWQTLRIDYVGTGETATVQFFANGGTADFYVDSVEVNTGGTWLTEYSRSYTSSSAQVSQTWGSSMTFDFTGTGFDISIPTDREGGEVQVCFGEEANYNATEQCFTYQHEESRGSALVSRGATGLANNTYTVIVRDAEDGRTATDRRSNTAPRNSRYPVSNVIVDALTIFDDTLPPTVPAGFYNEDAADGTNTPYVQTFSTSGDVWGELSGRSARGFTNESYIALLQRGRASRTNANGGLNLQVNVSSTTSIVFYLGGTRANRSFSNQVLVCADGAQGEIEYDESNQPFLDDTNLDCELFTDLTTTTRFVVDETQIDALGDAGTHTITVRPLTPGNFYIDGFQIIDGTVLSPGIYDDFLPESLLDFGASDLVRNTTSRDCDVTTNWCQFSVSRGAYGGTSAQTAVNDAELNFDFSGTGFSIISSIGTSGVDFRVCYKESNNLTAFPASTVTDDILDGDGDGIRCDLVTSDYDNWDTLMTNRPLDRARTVSEHGFTYYGLPNGSYSVEVRIIDNTIDTRDVLAIDAVAVFSDPTTTTLAPGLHDDTNAGLIYEPSPYWTGIDETNERRQTGYFNDTQHETGYMGAIVQMNVDGNAVILYGETTSATARGNICLVVSPDVLHCTREAETEFVRQTTDFSQNSRSRTTQAPIIFYGLGDGEHHIIMENADTNTRNTFNVDAIRVLE